MSDLPVPSAVKAPSEIDPWDLWHDVVAEVKKRIIQPSFWQAIETVIPILIEDTTLVVGLPEAAGYYASHLTGTENRTKLEKIILDLSGLPLKLRIIEGTEEEDWEAVKRREQIAQNASQAFRARLSGPAGTAARRAETWESLMEKIYSMFSRSQGHHLPQGRAEYLLQVIPIIANGSKELMENASPNDERNERALARILEKVGSLVEVPGAMVALELIRYQERHGMKRGN
jgi:hypothetical protein